MLIIIIPRLVGLVIVASMFNGFLTIVLLELCNIIGMRHRNAFALVLKPNGLFWLIFLCKSYKNIPSNVFTLFVLFQYFIWRPLQQEDQCTEFVE